MRDKDIRGHIHKILEIKYSNSTIHRIVNEMHINKGGNVVDIAILGKPAHAIEIKSDVDTLIRLPSQIKSYYEVFDLITVATTPKFLDKISQMVPDTCGLWSFSENNGEIKSEIIREATMNNDTVPFNIAQLLWKAEAKKLMGNHNIPKSELNKMRIMKMWKFLSKNIEKETLSAMVMEALLERADWKISKPIL